MRLSSTPFAWLLGWAAAVTAAPLAAHAGEARVLKIAVLEVKAVGTFDPKTVAGLGSLIATEAGRYPAKVVAGADLLALIGFDKQKQLLGCTDNSCLVQIGGALGVDFLLTSEVAAVGDRWLLTTTLLDVVKASALARSTKQAKTPGDLVDLGHSGPRASCNAGARPRADGDSGTHASACARGSGEGTDGLAQAAAGRGLRAHRRRSRRVDWRSDRRRIGGQAAL